MLVVFPIFQSARYSLYRWDGLGPITRFIGLENYKEIFQDPIFWKSLKNNLIVVFFSLATQMPPALFLAIILTGRIRGKSFLRTVYFAPQIVSTVAASYLFYYVYEPTFGLLNNLLKGIGLDSLTRGWLGDPSLALYAVMVVISWKYIGFYMVLFMAAIEGIPNELFEAARIDGCSSFQVIRKITLPLLSGTIKTACILSIVGSIKYFDLIWVMTSGGPAHSTELIATYMYKKTFLSWEMGYGAALAFVLFAIAILLSVGFSRLTNKKAEGR
ncbi:MAG: sugar ABC transporter permease [Sphaerochaetaceae bacterium]|nr:sugar ABC transporter permease [Sphaerochaetaceae bacterium]NLO59909.1 sugar ABC transporter permease [Spirochaetales bacterium]MDD2405422.1 sugar ABC transporter permease [Sphaerochaetaceae bacterium]MDD3670501.1 sugar ABC transporter permease [Sphaerochaetaceae bacterium]MDD4259437.1 sugar ABC transporter permease [Sphaerochaetaceae bacterium]